MKIALVHDYLREYGGAERVLEALCEIYPDAPIYTSFYTKGSPAYERFKSRDIRASWAHSIPLFDSKLHSPLRFLAPLIWGSFNFSGYDVVISSASWYVTKGFGRRNSSCHPEHIRCHSELGSESQCRLGSGSSSQSANRRMRSRNKFGMTMMEVRHDNEKRKPIEICYCHTPPRWLYGYKTSVEWQKYWPVKVYAAIIGHFMRLYDFNATQKVDYFIANSKEVAARIKKFYRRDAVVIYPPVDIASSKLAFSVQLENQKLNANNLDARRLSYYLVVSRLVGGKGIDLAIKAAQELNVKLKIAGAPAGYSSEYQKLKNYSGSNVEFVGRVSDEELINLYKNAKAFLALSQDEDFGITPVEAMACGTPVIAFRGGGYVESVIEGKTGVFFDKPTVNSLVSAVKQFNNLTIKSSDCIIQAQKFSKERFKREIKAFVAARASVK